MKVATHEYHPNIAEWVMNKNYDYFTNLNENNTGDKYKIKLSVDQKLLTIPIVEGDSMTSGVLRYEFDGVHFVYKGITK